jgi:molybdate/tungstate transport system ATP-binding protein
MIALQKLSVRIGNFSLEDISFEVPAGTYAVLMGLTGSGKTTLIEAICGLRSIGAGRILLRHQDVTALKPAQRGIGYVPQDGALFSTMSVRDNLAFALSIRGIERSAVDERVHELAGWLGISALLNRSIRGLSGGERQRIALGRALAAKPSVLCMDEPLSALDEETREQMYGLLETVNKHENVTVLHVTHNRQDADRLADQILRLNEGRIVSGN